MPAPASAPEMERLAAEMAALERTLAASRGTFSLSFAVCDSPALRDRLIARLRESRPGLRVVGLPEPTVNVLADVRQALAPGDEALFVVNLEASVPSSRSEHPVLRGLDATREAWASLCACPVVFWVPEYAVALVATHAPDFWAWRSHQFQFVPEGRRIDALPGGTAAGDFDFAAALRLDADRKLFRIAELEARLADPDAGPDRPQASQSLDWRHELALLLAAVGETGRAEQVAREGLVLAERIGSARQRSRLLTTAGLLRERQGDLGAAERAFRESLDLAESAGHAKGTAASLLNLAGLQMLRDETAEAEETLQRALSSAQQAGDTDALAGCYGNLGILRARQGRTREAEQSWVKALDLARQTGSPQAESLTRIHLAMLRRGQGDLASAEELLRAALGAAEGAGLAVRQAEARLVLGAVRNDRGDLAAARGHWEKARDLFARCGLAAGAGLASALMDQHRGDG